MSYIGLDVGSTGCKAAVIGKHGEKLSESYREYDKKVNAAEMDPSELWDKVKEVIGESVKLSGEKPEALAISSFGESFVPVGKDGEPLNGIMFYTDPRGEDQCREFLEKLGDSEIMRRSGAKAHPMYSLPKIAWLRENKPRVFDKTDKFMLIADYIGFRLSGEAVIPWSLAARTLAFNIEDKKWDEKLLGLAGIDKDRMSVPAQSGTVSGKILPSVAEELDLSHEMKIITGGHDQVMAVVGSGAEVPGTAAYGMGTVDCVVPVFGKPVFNTAFMEYNYCSIPYAADNSYVTYAFSFSGGSMLKWFRDSFAQNSIEEAKKAGISSYALLDRQCAKEPGDVMVIPHFAGSGTPELNTASKGAIYPMDFSVGLPELYRAVLDGVAYEMRYNAEILADFGIYTKEYRATGGGSRSPLWMEIKASVLNTPIIPLDTEEAGVQGTAMLCAVACGEYSSIKEASEQFVKCKTPVLPDRRLASIYDEKYGRYKEIREQIKKLDGGK